MDDLSQREQKKYDEIWRFHPEYREDFPSKYLTPIFLEIFKNQIKEKDQVIDFGCGTGVSTKFLLEKKLNVHLIDISEHCLNPEIFLLSLKQGVEFLKASLWNLPKSIKAAEWILCFDVMEHIPEEKVSAVLESISVRMKIGGFLSLSLRHDQFGKRIGETLHCTVKPKSWWMKKLNEHFSVDKDFSVAGALILKENLHDTLIVSLLPKKLDG